jgi:hypothetical protein
MSKICLAFAIIGLAFASACQSAQSGAGSPNPAAASASPSAAASPTPNTNGPVLVGLAGINDNVTLVRVDGSVVATLPNTLVPDQRPIGAFLVAAKDGSGEEWTVDRAGAIKQVAPAAARLLTAGSNPLILTSTAAVIGCQSSANADCTAAVVDLGTGSVRKLVTVPTTASVMRYGASLQVLNVTSDLQTVWFRQVSGATTVKLAILGVDLRTGNVTTRDLTSALSEEQDLTISRDGKWVGGQEQAGTNSSNLAIRDLHVVSLETGVDRDVQGTAVYVGGQIKPTIAFSPDASRIEWWGGLNNGSLDWRVNTSPIAGTGKTILGSDNDHDANSIRAVFWLDASHIVVQFNGMSSVDADTGTSTPIADGSLTALLGVL